MKTYGPIREIVSELLKLDMDKLYVCEVKEPTKKRSLDQNRLLWKLVHLIAKETCQEDNDVYCGLLERADALSDYVITATDMGEASRKTFRGVKFMRMQEVNGKDCFIFKVYLGSSKMDTKEMTQLIDVTMQVCAELGVDARSEWYEK